MSAKAKMVIGWILTALLGALFIFSASMKLMGGADAMKAAATFGLSADALKILGMTELLSVVLFAIPRTGVLGLLLLSAYIGGAIATHLEHNLPVFMPMIVEAVIWIAAVLRFPEISRRLMGRNAGSIDRV